MKSNEEEYEGTRPEQTPDGVEVAEALWDVFSVAVWFVFWAIVGIPYLIYKHFHRKGTRRS